MARLLAPGWCIAVALLVAALAAPPRLAAAPAPDTAAIDRYVEAVVAQQRIPGLAIALVQDDRVVHLRGFGVADPTGRPVTAQTPFILGSTSKSFTALAVMQLVEAGAIDLDAPVQRYLPWFEVGGVEASHAVKVRHLLNHTSGIPNHAGEAALSSDDHSPDALERQVRGLSTWTLAHPPGMAYEYANANYQTAALIVQTVAGMPFETYIQQHVFAPLAMDQSFTSKAEAQAHGLASGYNYWLGYPVAARATPYPRQLVASGFLISSAEDLSHALIAHLNGGSYGGRRLISADGLAVLHRPALGGYAMGWAVNDGVLVHNGAVSDFGSQLLIDQPHRLGIAVLFNVNSAVGGDHLYTLAPNILRLWTRTPLLPVPARTSYWSYLLGFGLLLVVELVWLRWSARRLWRWQRQPAQRPHGLRAVLLLGMPLLIEAALAAALWQRMPMSIRVMLLFQPDLTLLILLDLALLVGWGALRTALGVMVLGSRRSGYRELRPLLGR